MTRQRPIATPQRIARAIGISVGNLRDMARLIRGRGLQIILRKEEMQRLRVEFGGSIPRIDGIRFVQEAEYNPPRREVKAQKTEPEPRILSSEEAIQEVPKQIEKLLQRRETNRRSGKEILIRIGQNHTALVIRACVYQTLDSDDRTKDLVKEIIRTLAESRSRIVARTLIGLLKNQHAKEFCKYELVEIGLEHIEVVQELRNWEDTPGTPRTDKMRKKIIKDIDERRK